MGLIVYIIDRRREIFFRHFYRRILSPKRALVKYWEKFYTIADLMRNAHSVLRHNLRRLGGEHQVVVGVHALTLVLCFFPWFSAQPIGEPPFYYHAFRGESFLIGFLLFFLSMSVLLLFVDQLLEKHRIQLPCDKNYILLAVGAQQILLAILAWSVLLKVGAQYATSSLRFGLSAILLVHIIGAVAVYLHLQKSKQKKARSFFQHPGAVPSSQEGAESEE